MVPELFLAEFEMYVLLAVAQLEDDAYGLSIRRQIESRAGRPVSVGALYTTIARLEAKGYLDVQDPEAVSGRRGRPRRYCKITPAGRHAVSHSVSKLQRMAEGVRLDPVAEGAE